MHAHTRADGAALRSGVIASGLLLAGCDAAVGGIGTLVAIAIGVVALRWMRRKRAMRTAVEELAPILAEAMDALEDALPGLRLEIRDDGRELFVTRGRSRATLDMIAFGHAAAAGEFVDWFVRRVAATVDQRDRERNRDELFHVVECMGGAIEEENEDAYVVCIDARRCRVGKDVLAAFLWGLDESSDRISTIQRCTEEAIDSVPPLDRVRPLFVTPARDRRLEEMIAGVQQRTGAELAGWHDGTEPIEREVEGLPWPLGYVLDFGEETMSFGRAWIEEAGVSLEELHACALANIRAREPLSLPARGRLLIVEDEEQYAAAMVLLVPDLLGDDDVIIATAPSESVLLLAREGDRDVLRDMRELVGNVGDDAPIPDPVRVTARGFAPTGWTTLLGESRRGISRRLRRRSVQ